MLSSILFGLPALNLPEHSHNFFDLFLPFEEANSMYSKKPTLVYWLPALFTVLVLLGCRLFSDAGVTPAPPTSQPVSQPGPTEPVPTTPPTLAPAVPTLPVSQPGESIVPKDITPAPENTGIPLPGRKALGDHLTAGGPWLLISASSGIWAANADGSGLTRLTQELVIAPSNLEKGIAPGGKLLAFVSGDADNMHHLKLNLLSLPDGTLKTITPLTNPSTEPAADAVMLDDKVEATRAVTEFNSVAWSPDGKTLAFIGIQDGPSADLYTYSVDTGKIRRLSDGPSQAYDPIFSPDGQYIVNFGVETFGTGAGFSMAGGWATRADGSSVLTLFSGGGGTQEFRGWVNDHQFLINTWTPMCGAQDLRIFDLKDQTQYSLVKGCFSQAAATESTGLILVVGDGSMGAELQGLYAFGPNNITRRQLSKQDAGSLRYFPSGDFLVGTNSGYAIYSNTGELMVKAPQIDCKYGVSFAGYGMIYAWACASGAQDGVWVNGPGMAERQISNQKAYSPTWSPDNTLLFFSGKAMYRAFFPDFKPEVVTQIDGDVSTLAWANGN
jgi:WD40 repeat protein